MFCHKWENGVRGKYWLLVPIEVKVKNGKVQVSHHIDHFRRENFVQFTVQLGRYVSSLES